MKKRIGGLVVALSLVLVFGLTSLALADEVVMGFSNYQVYTPYSIATHDQVKAAAARLVPEWKLIDTDGQNNANKQINDIQDLMAKKIDILLMSPYQEAPLTPICAEVMEAGIPLVLIDRMILTEDYTAFVGGDNIKLGVAAGRFVIEKFGENANIVHLLGTLGASATNDRTKGFKDTIADHPGLKIVAEQSADYDRAKAITVMENLLIANPKIDVLVCQNDNMAFGAIEAIRAAGRLDEMLIVGMDGQKDAFDAIKEGIMAATIIYPTGADAAVEIARKIMNNEPFEKINLLDTPLITIENVDEYYHLGF